METLEQTRVENIILDLEKRYPNFKKMDIYATVSNAYGKIHSVFSPLTDRDLDAIKETADRELAIA